MGHRRIVIGMLLVASSLVNAQSVLDWILNPEEAATTYATGVANEMWDGFLNDQIKQSLSEDAQKIANYSIDSTKFAAVDNKYNSYTYGKSDYNTAVNKLRESILGYIYVTPTGGFKAYGKGVIIPYVEEQANKRKPLISGRLKPLYLLIETHPEVETLQQKWSGLQWLEDNPLQLYYWGVLAASTSLTPSYKLPSVESLDIRNASQRLTYNVYDGERLLGTLFFEEKNKCRILVADIDIINYHGMPNTTYSLGNIKLECDHIGRVVAVEQICNSAYKRKSGLNKKKLKIKNVSIAPGCEAYPLTNQKYNGVISGLSVVSIPQKKENKSVIKAIDKYINKIVKNKRDAKVTTNIRYRYASTNIESIDITVNDVQYNILKE